MNIQYFKTRLIYKIRFKLQHRLPVNAIKEHKKGPKNYLLGTIEHMNYGDQAINIGESKLLNDVGLDVINIPESFIDEALPLIKASIKPNDVIYCHGGGNMGDVWPEQEVWRQKIFKAFPDNNIVVFPQSVNYKEKSTLLKVTIEVAKSNKDLTILLRDKFSYQFVKDNFPENVNVQLVPDIVMTLDKSNSKIERKTKVTAFLRRDIEKLTDTRIEVLLKKLQSKYAIEYSDTVSDNWFYINENNRESFLDAKLVEFQSSRMIISDRLHGMVFAAITKTPAIIFDNNNHKIKNLYNTWLRDSKYIKFVDTSTTENEIDEILQQLEKNQIFKLEQTEFKNKIIAAIPTLERSIK